MVCLHVYYHIPIFQCTVVTSHLLRPFHIQICRPNSVCSDKVFDFHEKYFLADANRQIREEIIVDVLNLYNSNPTEESFRHYAPNAEFEDPLQYSGNLSSVKSAFKSLPKIFKDSEVIKSDADIETNPMRLNLETRYEWKAIKKDTIIRSIVLLTLNDQEQIVRHEERWNGEPIPHAESGFFGRIKEVRSSQLFD